MRLAFYIATTMAMAGCATESNLLRAPEADRYRCENDVAFTVKFASDSATVNSNRGYEVLYRSAGGLTPNQTVYSNPRMRAEFGLGATGQEAILRYLLQPVVVRCARD
jgi:hypothetical protein